MGGRRGVVGFEVIELPRICGNIEIQKTQTLERDEQRVAGERGKSRVRRVAIAYGREGHDLPESLSAKREPIDELVRAGAHIAHPMRTRKRGRVR